VLARFPSVRRLILIADRGLLSLDNLELLRAIDSAAANRSNSSSPYPAGVITTSSTCSGISIAPAVRRPARRSSTSWCGTICGLVVAHDPVMAAIQTQRRADRIEALIAHGEQWAGKLVEQDDGVKRRGRKLSDSGAKARFFRR